jgi:membrane protease YdiL (CAAX protease family)
MAGPGFGSKRPSCSFLFAAPAMARVACWILWGAPISRSNDAGIPDWTAFAISSFQSMVRKLQFIPVVLFVLWLSGDPWSRFGLVRPVWEKDVILGLVLYLAVAMLYLALRAPWSGFTNWTPMQLLPAQTGANRIVLLLATSCADGFSEELIGTGYLIARFESLVGSTWKALLLSIVLAVFMHLHKSAWGLLYSALSAAVWGLSFCLTRRIWPAAIAHALNNFVVTTHFAEMVRD